MSGLRRFLSRPGRLRAVLARLRRDASGVAAIEFALLAMPFFLLVFAILETSAVFMGEMTLNQAVARASRLVRTGEVASAALTEAEFKRKLCDEITLLLSCDKISIDLRTYTKFSDVPKTAPVTGGVLDTASFRFDKVQPGKIIVLRAFYRWPLFADILRREMSNLGDGSHLIMSVAVMKTEPFAGG